MANHIEIEKLKDRANTFFEDEVVLFSHPDNKSLIIIFESSEYAEQFVQENQNLKENNELVFSNIKFEKDNDKVYLS